MTQTKPLPKSGTRHPRPWYREPWLLMLIGVPATSVVLSLIMLTVALQGEDSLVRDDYYKEGLAINQNLERQNLARSLQLIASLRLDENSFVELTLEGRFTERPPWLTLRFQHPTLASHDQQFRMIQQGTLYRSDSTLPELIPGKWRVTLEDGQNHWVLKGTHYLPAETLRLGAPSDSGAAIHWSEPHAGQG